MLKSLVEKAGFELVTDYSGRGMFGATCFAFQTEDDLVETTARLFGAVSSLEEVGYLREVLKNVRTDSLGYSTVFYFPDLTEEEENLTEYQTYIKSKNLDRLDAMRVAASFGLTLHQAAAEIGAIY